MDEAFVGEEDRCLHAYNGDGTVVVGWPVCSTLATQERHTPAIADLDGDGDLEIITTSGVYVFAYHPDGTLVAGFPVQLETSYTDIFPSVGDVDGDGALEIVVVVWNLAAPFKATVVVLSAGGVLERRLNADTELFYGSAPALADLSGDGVPDIILQTDGGLYVWRGDGSVVPGWPRTWTGRWVGNSSPVVGDVTGDGQPDVVVTTQVMGSSTDGDVRVYDRNGVLHQNFPKALPIGAGAVPAIADIDGDGRNEIIVSGSYWPGVNGDFDIVWAYDLGGASHGPIPWGQFMANARHTGMFAGLVRRGLVVDGAPVTSDGNGVLEPGETVEVAPSWQNAGVAITLLTGTATSISGPVAPGVTYSLADAAARYGPAPAGATVTCVHAADCYAVGVAWAGTRPANHWDAEFTELLSDGTQATSTVHIGNSFVDVSANDLFYRFIETLLHRQVTAGCTAAEYCPSNSTQRRQMAVFVLRSHMGSEYVPPACTAGSATFTDVPAHDPFCRWIEELARRGVVSGCGGGAFCPGAPVSRAQLAVFALRTLEGANYLPPACIAGLERFIDVPASDPFCRWIEELARRGITTGCSPTTYCPGEAVSRGEMAVFLSLAFRMRLYGP